MSKVHLNWTGCRCWYAARAALKKIVPGATLYGNFADAEAEPRQLKDELESAGFIVYERLTPFGYDLHQKAD